MIELKIAYIRSSLHSSSGLVNHLLEIAKRIESAGHETVIICREAQIDLQGMALHSVNFTGTTIPLFRNLIFPFKTLRLLGEGDVIHTMYHPGIAVGSVASKLLGKPHVFTYHGFAPIRVWRNWRQRLKMIDHRLGTFLALRSNVKKIITVSHYLKNELIKKYLVKSDRIRVIYNGVDTQRFNPDLKGLRTRDKFDLNESPTVLFLGRLAPYKGVQYLLRAIPTVLKEIPETKFLIAGAMRYDIADLGWLLRWLNVRKSVIFTGYVPNRDIPDLYATCDVFCYPSLWEGFGLTPAEAQACGKPVVAFNNCAVPEVVKDKETGVLVEPKNIQGLANALISMLQDKKRRLGMGFKARERVRRLFSWEKAANETLEVYQEVLS